MTVGASNGIGNRWLYSENEFSQTQQKEFLPLIERKERTQNKSGRTSASLLSVVDFFGIHIVLRKPVQSYLFPLGPFFAVVAIGVYGNSAAGQKFAPYFDICRVSQINKVVHNYVHAILVKIAAVSEPEKIKL